MKNIYLVFLLIFSIPLGAEEQKTTGNKSPIVNTESGDVNITYKEVKKKKKPETCEAYLSDISIDSKNEESVNIIKNAKASDENMADYKEGMAFNECILRNEKKIVEISVWLDDSRLEDAEQYLEKNKQVYFHVSDQFYYDKDYNMINGVGGMEYLLSMGDDNADTTFIPAPRRLTTVSGYFKVSSIIGPFQGVMSVHLKGVRIEDIN